MEIFLFIIGALLGVAGFGFLVCQIHNEVVRWVTLGLGCVIGFFGFLLGLISMTV